MVHLSLSFDTYVPGRQAVHVVEPTLAIVPGAHGEQASKPALAVYLPTEQGSHDNPPTIAPNLPLAHDIHLLRGNVEL
jgi:hypothetical protein